MLPSQQGAQVGECCPANLKIQEKGVREKGLAD